MNNTQLSPHAIITIPRAEYSGTWHDFAADNAAFIPDHEMTRLERELAAKGVATHTAHTNGDFVITVSE